MGVPPLLPTSSVEIGRSGVAFVGGYGRADAPKDVPIVFLDLVNNRWCVPKVGIVPPLNADKIALLWGTEHGIGAFGAIDFQVSPCPPGPPCDAQGPVQAQSVGAMIDW